MKMKNVKEMSMYILHHTHVVTLIVVTLQTQQKEETPPRAVNSGQLNYFTCCSPT